MWTRILFLFWFFSVFTSLLAQSDTWFGGGAGLNALGGISTTQQNISTIYGNTAGLINLEPGFALDISGDQRFGLEELNTLSLGTAYHHKSLGAFGVSIQRFGSKLYLEQKVSIHYAKKLSSSLSAGASMNYIQYQIEKFGSTNGFTIDFGLNVVVSKTLTLAAQINNPINANFSERSRIPSRLAIGGLVTISKFARLHSELEKSIDTPLTFKMGVQYQLHPNLELMMGADLVRSTVGIGFAFSPGSFRLIGAYSNNTQISSYPSFSIQYQ